MEKISVTDLAEQYERQYNIINAKIAGLRPLLYVYTGEDLYRSEEHTSELQSRI